MGTVDLRVGGFKIGRSRGTWSNGSMEGWGGNWAIEVRMGGGAWSEVWPKGNLEARRGGGRANIKGLGERYVVRCDQQGYLVRKE